MWVQIYGYAALSARREPQFPTRIAYLGADGDLRNPGVAPFTGSRIALETRDHQILHGRGFRETVRGLWIQLFGEDTLRLIPWKGIRCLAVLPSSAALRNARLSSALFYGMLFSGLAYESWRFSREEYTYSRDVLGNDPSTAFWETVMMNLNPMFITPLQMALLFGVHAVLTDRMITRQKTHPPLVAVVPEDAPEDSVRVASRRCRWVAAALLLPRLAGDQDPSS